MGCLQNRRKTAFLDEFQGKCEPLIEEVEANLGLSKCSLAAYALGIARYRTNNRMSKDQLMRSMDSLGLDTSFFTNKDDPKTIFYTKFLVSKNIIEKLESLGVLLSKVPVQDKARILFQTYDRDCSKQIDKSEFYALITDIYYLSNVLLVDLAIAYNSGEDRNSLLRYKEILENQKHDILKFYEHALFYFSEDYIEFHRFINSVSGKGIKKMLSAQGCRVISYEIYKYK